MDNKDFIGKLSACTGFAEEETVRMVSSLIDCMAQGLQEGKDIQVQGFGLLGVQKEMEYISVNPLTKQRFLIPLVCASSSFRRDTFRQNIRLKETTLRYSTSQTG